MRRARSASIIFPMSLPTFFLAYEDYAEFTPASFKEVIESTPTKPLSEVTIGELCSMSDYPNGLYFIFGGEQRELQYVGKCTARSFIERIPAHFDQREHAWFNSLPKKLMKNGQFYSSALKEALSFEAILFGIHDKEAACRLERVFRYSYTPALNTLKKLNDFDSSATLDKLSDRDYCSNQEAVLL
jgi:hypothetical protein